LNLRADKKLKKIISIVGARPQFIKLAPLSRRLRTQFHELIVHTGQHFDRNMSSLFFDELAIPDPAYHLGIQGGDHGEQTGRMLTALEKVLIKEEPDLVIVFGDTNSTLAGALAAAKLHISVVHIEAGLRSFNKTMPEEINRIVSDHVSDFLFAPTQTGVENLARENLKDKTFLTGDIMLDALQENLDTAQKKSNVVRKLQLKNKPYCVLTLHRPYNVDQIGTLKPLLEALARCGKEIIFPVHPRTRSMITAMGITPGNTMRLIDPLGYFDFLVLQTNAEKIITDSGGVQKEAYLLKVPCITIRPETEWLETVRDGWNILTDFKTEALIHAVEHFTPGEVQHDLFGTYPVGVKMLDIIKKNI
jgi:UDP-N-acetylglucosamine 2-epimerase